MASRMIGRATCPECGFGAAHVKQSEKCIYRYCPECGSQFHAKTERQRTDLTAKMRPLEDATGNDPSASPREEEKNEPALIALVAPTPTGASHAATPHEEAKPKRRGLFA